MTPGDETIGMMRSVAREEVDRDADAAKAQERLERERASTRMGYLMLAVAVLILLANITADLLQRQRPEFSVAVVTMVVLLAFGGGALIQGVRLDKILTAWRRGNGDGA